MKLTTTRIFSATAMDLWPLLFNSKMDAEKPCYFLCGLPKPVECRLAGGEGGGVGQTRECVSDRGTIRQTILDWEPGKLLRFELRETDIYFGPCVESIVETFEIKQLADNRASITRQTAFSVRSVLAPFISVPLYIGLKSIHRYVFRNWERLSTHN